ncbi:MAG: AI-2E family transporter, partial [Phycisphaeraceae bacterium]|nr:AI-2E family transporter [Phycisphaeraceae bacterium]
MSRSPRSSDEARPDWARLHIWQITAVRDVFWGALVLALLAIGYQLSSIFTPVLIALALAYLFHPLITLCEDRWKMPRPLTISIILGLVLLVLAGLIAWLGPLAYAQTKSLVSNAPNYAQKARQMAEERGMDPVVFESAQKRFAELRDDFMANPSEYLAGKVTMLLSGTGTAFKVIAGLIGGTVYLVVSLCLIPVYFFFFAWQFGPLVRQFKQYLPASNRDRWLEVLGMMDEAVATYFRDRVVIGLIMSVLFSVGWGLCGVPSWLLLGVAAGMLSLIPFVSTAIWPIAVALAFFEHTGEGALMWGVIAPTVVFGVVQFLEAWVLTPRIHGKSMEMSVVTILIVMLVGSA